MKYLNYGITVKQARRNRIKTGIAVVFVCLIMAGLLYKAMLVAGY